jgi:hypothetical protein
MPNYIRSWGLTAGALVALCACQDVTGPTAPQQARVSAPSAALSRAAASKNAPGGAVTAATADGVTLTTFVYTPRSGGSYDIAGGHQIVFPSYSVCDPETSTYGPTEWDAPCAPATAPITISVRSWVDADGHPRVDFQPALRFVPNHNSNRWVILHLHDDAAFKLDRSELLTIYYCDDAGACVDDTQGDRTMRTHVARGAGKVWRRIKHFSGYNVTAGRSEPAAEAY